MSRNTRDEYLEKMRSRYGRYTGRYDPVLDIPLSPNRLEIPEGCYFIVQDSAGGGFDSRVLSWARTESIVGSQLWYLSGRGLFKPVE